MTFGTTTVMGQFISYSKNKPSKVEFILVGCGVPKKSMGWYHALNILDGYCPGAELTHIVEPFFMTSPGKDTAGGKLFTQFMQDTQKRYGVQFHASVAQVPPPPPPPPPSLPSLAPGKTPRVAMICGRTADNPELMRQVIEVGTTHVFLEKPGAPTVRELQDMDKYAAEKAVEVIMGYNKNISKYVMEARAFEKNHPKALTTYVSNNAYRPDQLAECFERNSEGMMKNMAIHEITLLVTYYGVTADNIASLVVDKHFSRLLTLPGPSSGKTFTDFAAIAFTITTTQGVSASIRADRCGGAFAEALVSVDDQVMFSSRLPDKHLEKKMNEIIASDPELMPYFPMQHDDYVELKQKTAQHILDGKKGTPPGLATIGIAIEALKVAEKLTKMLQTELSNDVPRSKL